MNLRVGMRRPATVADTARCIDIALTAEDAVPAGTDIAAVLSGCISVSKLKSVVL